MKDLEIVDAETLLYNPLGQAEYVVEDIRKEMMVLQMYLQE